MLANNEKKIIIQTTLEIRDLLFKDKALDENPVSWDKVKYCVSESSMYSPSLLYDSDFHKKTTFDFLDIAHKLYKPTKDIFDYARFISIKLNGNQKDDQETKIGFYFEERENDLFLRLEKL